jgi:hypothetical protein
MTAFAGGVTSLEDHDDPLSCPPYPILQNRKLRLQLAQCLLEILALQLWRFDVIQESVGASLALEDRAGILAADGTDGDSSAILQCLAAL